MKNIKQITR